MGLDQGLDINTEALRLVNENCDRRLKQMEAEIAVIQEGSEAIGMLKMINYSAAHNEVLKYAILYRIKKMKEYKKSESGPTWEKYCNENVQESSKTVDRILKDIGPLIENWRASVADLIGMPLSKIRYLGRSVAAGEADFNGEAIVYEGRKIPITPENTEDIEALIESLQEVHKKEKEDLIRKHERESRKQERIAQEEIESLKVERSALVKENQRLKVFDIEEKPIEWNMEQVKTLNDSAMTFVSCCEKFIVDPRLQKDLHVQAKVMVAMNLARNAILDLEEQWNDVMNPPRDFNL